MKRVRIMPKDHWDWDMPVSFSQGWKINNIIFIGGQVPRDKEGNTVGVDNIKKQTHNVFSNIQTVLGEVESGFESIVQLTIFYTLNHTNNPELFREKIMNIAMQYFKTPGPAVTEVCVDGFARDGVFIEIEAIAVVDL